MPTERHKGWFLWIYIPQDEHELAAKLLAYLAATDSPPSHGVRQLLKERLEEIEKENEKIREWIKLLYPIAHELLDEHRAVTIGRSLANALRLACKTTNRKGEVR